jgi:hypothetical protein
MGNSEEPKGNNETQNGANREESRIYPRFHPGRAMQWYCRFDNIERFTLWVAFFTAVLAVVAALQYIAFRESERAFLIVQNGYLASGEPVSDRPISFIINIKNVGKHTAKTTSLNVSVTVNVRRRFLTDNPEYAKMNGSQEVAPIAPGIIYPFVFRGDAINPGNTLPAAAVEGIINGTIGLFIFWFFQYESGYFSLWSPNTGFCFEYIPPALRSTGSFEICRKEKYIYAY